MGDALDASEEALYNFNTMAVHENFMKLIDENQGVSGDVPVVIPAGNPGTGSCNDVAWTAAYPLLTHDLYTYFGDIRVVERRWPSLVRYIENLIAKASASSHDLAECDEFQDWLCGNGMSCCSKTGNISDVVSCPVPAEMGSFNYVLALEAMTAMAEALGKAENSTRYSKIADTARHSFHQAFYNGKTGTYGNDFGAVQSLTLPALQIGAPPVALLPHVVQTLQDDLASRTDYHLAVGAVTSKILLNVLSDHGLHQSAMRVATQTTEPSWGYWLSQNSTT
jgi:alpha-L-rhamnosidase